MSSFPAAYAGSCGNCGEHFGPGEMIAYEEGAVTVQSCCGTPDDPRTTPTATEPDRVMPRGMTAADRCDKCFQIPSSNGLCGCAW